MNNDMSLQMYLDAFDLQDTYESGCVDVDRIVSHEVGESVNSDGFAIVRNAVSTEVIQEMREYWLGLPKKLSLSSNIMLGHENYSHCFFGRYTRHFEFYWNIPSHKASNDISLLLHYARNKVLGLSPFYGLTYLPGRVGIYLSLTHYPLGSGEMAIHVDSNYFLQVHYNLPLTYKGIDYKEGGLYIKKEQKFIDIDEKLQVGDLLLFNGNIPHGIKRTEGKGIKSSVGRLQLFSIPTVFDQVKRYSLWRELLFDWYGRVRYRLYDYKIGFNTNNKNFR